MKKIVVFVILCLGLFAMTGAQKIVDDKSAVKPIPKIACFPPLYLEGGEKCDNKTAIGTVATTAKELMQSLGMEWIDEGKINGAVTASQVEISRNELPKPADLLRVGKALGVDYIFAYRCAWRVRSVWVTLGPKTKAHAKVELIVVDVKKEEIAFKGEGPETDSTKKEEGWATAGALLLTPVFTVVSGGPKTPHMQRAGQQAFLIAIKPWAEVLQPAQKKIKIDK